MGLGAREERPTGSCAEGSAACRTRRGRASGTGVPGLLPADSCVHTCFIPFQKPQATCTNNSDCVKGEKILPTDAHTHTHTHEKQESDSMQGALREHRGSRALRAGEPPPPAPRGRGLRAAPPGTQAPESAGRVQRRWALPPPANGQVALPPASLLPRLL